MYSNSWSLTSTSALEIGEGLERNRIRCDFVSRNRFELDLGRQNDPRQTQAAHRGAKEFDIVPGTAFDDALIRAAQEQACDVKPKCARAVVILSVNIIGDRASDGDELRPRRDRQEPPARHRNAQNLRQ